MYKKIKLNRNEEGQSMVEFALLLPILMIILLGIVEFGFMFNAQITLNSASREYVRIYAITNSQIDANDIIKDTVDSLDKKTTYAIVAGTKPLDNFPEVKMAHVYITKDVHFITNFFNFLIPSNKLSLDSYAEMRVEHDLLTTGGE